MEREPETVIVLTRLDVMLQEFVSVRVCLRPKVQRESALCARGFREEPILCPLSARRTATHAASEGGRELEVRTSQS